LGIREDKDLEETVEATTFGSVIHYTLGAVVLADQTQSIINERGDPSFQSDTDTCIGRNTTARTFIKCLFYV